LPVRTTIVLRPTRSDPAAVSFTLRLYYAQITHCGLAVYIRVLPRHSTSDGWGDTTARHASCRPTAQHELLDGQALITLRRMRMKMRRQPRSCWVRPWLSAERRLLYGRRTACENCAENPEAGHRIFGPPATPPCSAPLLLSGNCEVWSSCSCGWPCWQRWSCSWQWQRRCLHRSAWPWVGWGWEAGGRAAWDCSSGSASRATLDVDDGLLDFLDLSPVHGLFSCLLEVLVA